MPILFYIWGFQVNEQPQINPGLGLANHQVATPRVNVGADLAVSLDINEISVYAPMTLMLVMILRRIFKAFKHLDILVNMEPFSWYKCTC